MNIQCNVYYNVQWTYSYLKYSVHCTMYIKCTLFNVHTVSIQWTYKVLTYCVHKYCTFQMYSYHCTTVQFTVSVQFIIYNIRLRNHYPTILLDYSLRLSGNDLCLKTNNYIFLSPKLSLFKRLIHMFVPDYEKT